MDSSTPLLQLLQAHRKAKHFPQHHNQMNALTVPPETHQHQTPSQLPQHTDKAKRFPPRYPHTLPVPPDSSTSNTAVMLWPNHQETTHSSSSTSLVNIKHCSHTVAKPSGGHLSVPPKLMIPPTPPPHYQTAILPLYNGQSACSCCHGDYFP